jgi:hypothetical protein
MTPKYTDEHKYPRGYVRSESTNVAKTWAQARERVALASAQQESNVRMFNRLAAHG